MKPQATEEETFKGPETKEKRNQVNFLNSPLEQVDPECTKDNSGVAS